jgi:hypothetical protein
MPAAIRIFPGGRVRCRATLSLDLPAGAVWGQLRDFHRYASHDPFHTRIDIDGDGLPRPGASLVLVHRYGPFRTTRVGRIVRWHEGRGYAFSDLAQRDPARSGFPHVFSFDLTATGPARCTLTLQVRGRWTARLVPRPLAWLWLTWVFTATAGRTQNDLLRYALAVRDRKAR